MGQPRCRDLRAEPPGPRRNGSVHQSCDHDQASISRRSPCKLTYSSRKGDRQGPPGDGVVGDVASAQRSGLESGNTL